MSIVLMYVFFFKQKTAYEMRISDWSSDVCSSDLGAPKNAPTQKPILRDQHPRPPGSAIVHFEGDFARFLIYRGDKAKAIAATPRQMARINFASARTSPTWSAPLRVILPRTTRSEEHTSELQSLMRISYAVFCLKKKTINRKY